MLGLALYIAALSVYLAVGPQTIDSWLPQSWAESERIHFFVRLAKKLLVFVFIPFALFGPPCRCGWRDFGLQWASFRESVRSHLPVIVLVSAAILAFQYFFGGGAAPLRQGQLSSRQLLLGLPLAFVWLAIEAGLVEEFFFRGLLQARLSAWCKSEVSAVVIMSLAFGLAHAPGLHFSQRRRSGRPGRESFRARCHRLFHRDLVYRRNSFRRGLGAHEKSHRAHHHSRGD